MALIGAAGLSSNQKRNFDSTVTRFGKNVGLIKLQFEFNDELYGANRRGMTFLRRKSFETF